MVHAFWNSAQWPFKVIQGRRWFYQSMRNSIRHYYRRDAMLARVFARATCPSVVTLILNSNFGPILPRFTDISAFVHRKQLFSTPHPLFRPVFRGVPFGVYPWCWDLPRVLVKISHEIIFDEFQPMWPRYLDVTDRHLDRRRSVAIPRSA